MPSSRHKHFRQRRRWPLPLVPLLPRPRRCGIHRRPLARARGHRSRARARSSISRAHEAGAASPVAVSAGCGAANVVVVRVLVPTAAALRHPLSSRTAREHQSSAREVIDLTRARGWGCLTGGRVGRMRRRRRRRRPFPCPLGRGVAASIVVPHGAGASV